MPPTGSNLSPHLKKAVWALGLGCLVVLGPWGLDHWATGRAERVVRTLLERRVGGRVTVGAVRAQGPFGLRVENLRVRWPGSGEAVLTLPQVHLRFGGVAALGLRLQVRSLKVDGGSLVWKRPDAVNELRRLARRVRRTGPRTKPRSPESKGTGGSQGSKSLMALEARLDRIEIAEVGGGLPPYGFARLVSKDLRLARTADGRWRAGVRSVTVGGARGVAAALTGLRWEGLNRRRGGIRTRKLRVASGEVRVKGVAGARERFSLRADEVAPDLLEIRVVSPPRSGRSEATRPVNAQTRGLSVYAVVDGVKRQARAEAGGLMALRHFNRFTLPTGVDLSAARIRGLFKGTATGRESTLTTDATLTRVRIRRRALAPHAIWWPRLGLKVKVRYQPRRRRLVLDRGDLTIADVPVQLNGTVTLAKRSFRLRLHATLAPTPCAKLFAAVPPQLVPKLRGLSLGGRMGARLDVALDSRALKDLKLAFTVRPQTCRVILDAPAARVAALRRPFTFVTRPPGWKPTRLVMGPQNPNWRSFNRLGRSVKAAFLAAEDRRFFQHRGFDLENIRRALATNLRQRSLLKGASSISQQVVKNVFLSHRRDFSRKIQEVILTWRMEQVLTKRRILEIYLNLVEMGPGIFGVRAAAKHYFQREPSHLNPLEAAHLAAVTPSPRRYFKRFRAGRAGMDWLLHLRWLMYQMLRIGWIDRAAYDKFRKQDLRLISY